MNDDELREVTRERMAMMGIDYDMVVMQVMIIDEGSTYSLRATTSPRVDILGAAAALRAAADKMEQQWKADLS